MISCLIILKFTATYLGEFDHQLRENMDSGFWYLGRRYGVQCISCIQFKWAFRAWNPTLWNNKDNLRTAYFNVIELKGCYNHNLDKFKIGIRDGVVVLPLTLHAEDRVFKSSVRQAVQATKLWWVEALIRASKVTRVHSGFGLRLPMLQRYSCTERTVAETHKKRRSTTSLLGSATYLLIRD